MQPKTLPIRSYDERVRVGSTRWMGQFSQHFTLAITASICQPDSKHEIYVESIWKKFEDFCKYLNRLAYGHAGKRGKKKLLIIASLEGQNSATELHFHIALGCVDNRFNNDELTVLFNNAWRKVNWTLNRTKIKPYRDSGWDRYIHKESVWLDLQAGDLAYSSIPPSLKAEVLS